MRRLRRQDAPRLIPRQITLSDVREDITAEQARRIVILLRLVDPCMVIDYRGTDAADVFRMGVMKLPDDKALQAWRAERADWRELTVTVAK